jgi:hypothetical protein
MFKLLLTASIATIVLGIYTSNIGLTIAALVVFILTLALQVYHSEYIRLRNLIHNMNTDSQEYRSPEFSTLTFSQKLLYKAAFNKGANTIITKLKNNI